MPRRAPNDPIAALVNSFAADLSALVRQAAVDAVREALGQRSAGAAHIPTKKGGKRRPEEIEATTKELLARIKKNPGQRIETIAGSMGVGTKDLRLPAKKLLAAKLVKTKGRKRATSYWAR